MIKLRCSKKLLRSSSKSNSSSGSSDGGDAGGGRGEIEWEVRPGGMLVQKRDGRADVEVITVRVATGFSWHDVSIGATCTFGEVKVVLSMVTGLEPREQRLLFRGKEREDSDHLHMVGVRDRDKVLLLEVPALKGYEAPGRACGESRGESVSVFYQGVGPSRSDWHAIALTDRVNKYHPAALWVVTSGCY